MDLVSADLKLRSFLKEDADALVKLCNNINIWRNIRDALPHPYQLSDAHNFIQLATSKTPQEIFAIDKKNELVGCIGIHPQDDVYRFSAEIGYWIGEPYWGQGLATAALQLIINYGFETLGMSKLYAGCFEFNKASQKVLVKAGFRREAILKKAVFKNDSFYDEIRYAIFRDDDENKRWAKTLVIGQI
ncbi:GNAT family N-acetyltransferase [Muriicola sp. Z0-33]|uniref:GNAT family N-acetyltransferase n=1 Tax=Muriicola sp. Z0-33 TaxID=2816957 RepID=UPI002238115A|nr:GNAT family protein [Muriicola sp. Z0-33]MCW5517903.1 GNAT family N-acetyltransferase [Muriicola sp. Z0-33]